MRKEWLQGVKDDKRAAYCKLCCRKFKLASIGKVALKFHMEGAKHQKCIINSAKSVPIAGDFHDQIETLKS